MKNILLITSLYPADDIQFKNNTAVCHYFAKEWERMGYHVRVVTLYNVYPFYYYPILKLAKNFFADRFGVAILEKRATREHNYEMDGIRITRLPAYKSKPHGDFSSSVIDDLTERIYNITREEQFVPDFILGHFILPCIRIIAALKQKYPNAITTTALHGKETKQHPTILACLNFIDYIGYRSYPIKQSFEAIYGKIPYFMCMSGVPAEYIIEQPKAFDKGIHNFIYVGSFMKRKYPSSLIPAIYDNYPKKDFTITYVGDGNGIKDVKKVAKRYSVTEKIVFTGRIPRPEIIAKLDAADVFIMISKNETFGLVWLEAMARGSIAIASRDEGMDGIIVNGENGFLCAAGDEKELASVIAKIMSMDAYELKRMSRNAIETARRMTDRKMAEEYIKAINI